MKFIFVMRNTSEFTKFSDVIFQTKVNEISARKMITSNHEFDRVRYLLRNFFASEIYKILGEESCFCSNTFLLIYTAIFPIRRNFSMKKWEMVWKVAVMIFQYVEIFHFNKMRNGMESQGNMQETVVSQYDEICSFN